MKKGGIISVRSTKHKGTFRVVYKEEFFASAEARGQENQLKRYKNTDYLKILIKKKSTLSSSLV